MTRGSGAELCTVVGLVFQAGREEGWEGQQAGNG